MAASTDESDRMILAHLLPAAQAFHLAFYEAHVLVGPARVIKFIDAAEVWWQAWQGAFDVMEKGPPREIDLNSAQTPLWLMLVDMADFLGVLVALRDECLARRIDARPIFQIVGPPPAVRDAGRKILGGRPDAVDPDLNPAEQAYSFPRSIPRGSLEKAFGELRVVCERALAAQKMLAAPAETPNSEEFRALLRKVRDLYASKSTGHGIVVEMIWDNNGLGQSQIPGVILEGLTTFHGVIKMLLNSTRGGVVVGYFLFANDESTADLFESMFRDCGAAIANRGAAPTIDCTDIPAAAAWCVWMFDSLRSQDGLVSVDLRRFGEVIAETKLKGLTRIQNCIAGTMRTLSLTINLADTIGSGRPPEQSKLATTAPPEVPPSAEWLIPKTMAALARALGMDRRKAQKWLEDFFLRQEGSTGWTLRLDLLPDEKTREKLRRAE